MQLLIFVSLSPPLLLLSQVSLCDPSLERAVRLGPILVVSVCLLLANGCFAFQLVLLCKIVEAVVCQRITACKQTYATTCTQARTLVLNDKSVREDHQDCSSAQFCYRSRPVDNHFLVFATSALQFGCRKSASGRLSHRSQSFQG